MLGGMLLIVGLLLPWGVIAVRTRQAVVKAPDTANQTAVGALRPEMVRLPTGPFRMGSPVDEPGRKADESQHQTEIQIPFAIAVTEVTQGQYQRVMGALPPGTEPAAGSGCGQPGQTSELPVACVTWSEAVAFCNRLSELEKLTPCYHLEDGELRWSAPECLGYRLPTEAEWEYAARAGGSLRYAGTDADDDICRYANVLDQTVRTPGPSQGFACRDGYTTAAPVRLLQPNAWFLYDMTGNVAEWVWSPYEVYPLTSAQDPTSDAGQTPTPRVVRGGSWQSSSRTARLAARASKAPSGRAVDIGFRIVRSFLK